MRNTYEIQVRAQCHKRGCKYAVERTVGMSGPLALRQVGVTVIDEKQRQYVEFPT